MGYALDIILVCIFLLFVIVGVKRGFIKSAARFLGAVLSACLAAAFGGMAAAWIFDTLFRGALVERITESISGLGGAEAVQSVLQSLPDFIVRALEEGGVTAGSISGSLATQQGEAAQLIADALAPIFIGFLKVLAVIVLFMLFMMLTRILSNILSAAFSLPILNQLNALLGGVFGLLLAFVSVWIVLAAVQVFTPMLSTEVQAQVETAMRSSLFAGAFIHLNPLSIMFS